MRSEMRSIASTEVARMQAEVRTRIDEEFRKGNITRLVQAAAREQTQTALAPLIKNEVSSQVKNRVDAEQGHIRLAVNEETKKAVQDLGPALDRLVRQATERKVDAEVRPIGDQLNSFKQIASVASLAVRTLADDARALDALLPLTTLPENDERSSIAQSAVSAAFLTHNRSFYETRGFNPPLPNRDQLLEHLSNPNPLARKAAIDTLATQKDKAMLPRLLEIMRSDPDLHENVRESGFRAFNQITGQHFVNLDFPAVWAWWLVNQQRFR